ncbi:MAG: TraR/DksA C4-type zinc finger protein [Desulfobulbaceae bacterium]|nr:TraR/DksA C4-type zinc finger protein [Desulfobulbaceae bacterium]
MRDPMDEGDVAQDYQARHNQESINLGIKSMGSDGPGTLICVDCEKEIPEERRRMQPSCTRCVECQTAFEETTRRIR